MRNRSRNVRITYPNSLKDILEVDFIQEMEVCCNLPFAELRHYLKDGKVKIQQNFFALPNYRQFLFSKVARIYPTSGEFPYDGEGSGKGVFTSERNRNVRITYPDSTEDPLKIDVVKGMEVCCNLSFAELRDYLKNGVIEIQQNLFALPCYHKFLCSKVIQVCPRDGEFRHDSGGSDGNNSLNFVLKWIPGTDEESLEDNKSFRWLPDNNTNFSK